MNNTVNLDKLIIHKVNDTEVTIFDVASWFIYYLPSVTGKSIQTLTYYSYVWYLAFNNIDDIKYVLFNANWEAWIGGPSNNDLYDWLPYNKHKSIAKRKIFAKKATLLIDNTELINTPNKTDSNGFRNNFKNNFKIDTHINDLLKQVAFTYAEYTWDELEALVHKEMPWIKSREGLYPWQTSNSIININDIFTYYSSLI